MGMDVNKTQCKRRQQVKEVPADAFRYTLWCCSESSREMSSSHTGRRRDPQILFFRVEKILWPLSSVFQNTLASGSYLRSCGRE